jgi:undecaprenyl-diphosphatase
VIFLIILLTEKNWRKRLHLLFFSIISLAVSYGIIKNVINVLFYHSRPFVDFEFIPLVNQIANASMPSAHATIFFTLASIMIFWINKKWGYILLVGAIFIGIARIFAGVHYPMDILVGALIGLITPFLVELVFKRDTNLVVDSKLDKIDA